MEEIIDYVTETPQNTNPNVLKGMLNKLASGEGGESGGSSILVVECYHEVDTETGASGGYFIAQTTYTAEAIQTHEPLVCFAIWDSTGAYQTFEWLKQSMYDDTEGYKFITDSVIFTASSPESVPTGVDRN